MDLEIRICKQDDFPSIFKLLKTLWVDFDLNFEHLQTVYFKAIQSENQKLIVGTIKGQIVGFCSLTIKNNLWLAGKLGHVDEIVVDESFRGQGIGKKLMERITEIAKENSCKRIELDSAFHRKNAHGFYKSIGYEVRAYLFSKTLN